MSKPKCGDCPEYNHGVGTDKCKTCGETQSESKEDAIRAILSELPDNTTPSSRYLKELILPKLEKIRKILK